jgi:hypothetical protein
MKAYRLQITIKNEELFKTIMSIPKTQRGQFITMALHEYIKNADGRNLLKMFATHRPDESRIAEEVPEDDGQLDDIMGEF